MTLRDKLAQSIILGLEKHEERYPGSTPYAVEAKVCQCGDYVVSIAAEHFSERLVYVVKATEIE